MENKIGQLRESGLTAFVDYGMLARVIFDVDSAVVTDVVSAAERNRKKAEMDDSVVELVFVYIEGWAGRRIGCSGGYILISEIITR